MRAHHALSALALVAMLAAPATAAAGGPPDPGALARAGLRVSWPLRDSPGLLPARARVTVRVRRLHRGAAVRRHRAVVTLSRVSRDGRRVLAVLRRSVLRSGTFSARLGPAAGARYALTLDVAGRRYRATIRTAPRVPSPMVPPSGPAPPPAALPPTPLPPTPLPVPPPSAGPPPITVAPGASSLPSYIGRCSTYYLPVDGVSLAVDRARAAPGDTLVVTLTNAGTGCFAATIGELLQRRDDAGAWTTVPGQSLVPAAVFIAPSATLADSVTLAAGLPPGTYRFAKELQDEIQADSAGPAGRDVGVGYVTSPPLTVVPAGR